MSPQQPQEEDDYEDDELERRKDPDKTNTIEERARALQFWMQDDWESIMNMYTNDGFYDALLCWIRPNRDFLSFLHAEIRRLEIRRIVSVGCGCGFLEWLLRRACSGLEILGYEVDRGWWQGRYGVRPFIDHVYVDETKNYHIPSGTALMTCYFHNWDHWNKYLKNFCGNLLIVIGPHSNGHLSCPQPRHILDDKRFIIEKQRAITGGDMVVIARRNEQLWPVPADPSAKRSSNEPGSALVRSATDKDAQKKQYNEMRRALVLQRIGSAKNNPRPPPVPADMHMGPRLQSTYKTKKPSLLLGVGAVSVMNRLKTLDSGTGGGKEMLPGRRHSLLTSSGKTAREPPDQDREVVRTKRKKKKKRKSSIGGTTMAKDYGSTQLNTCKQVSRSEPYLTSIGWVRFRTPSPLPTIPDEVTECSSLR